jgi:hypothetical protein
LAALASNAPTPTTTAIRMATPACNHSNPADRSPPRLSRTSRRGRIRDAGGW